LADPNTLHLQRIERRLELIFEGKIDMSDCSNKREPEKKQHFNSRALAALLLLNKAGISVEDAAASVIDAGDDDGIDAVFYSTRKKILYLVQSKFKTSTNKGIDLAEFIKFRDGVSHVLRLDDNFISKKLKKSASNIRSALDDIDTKIHMCFVHTSEQELSVDIQKRVDEIKSEHNKHGQFLEFFNYGISDVISIARSEARPSDIDLQVMMRNFGVIREPYLAYYGEVAASDVADWLQQHKDKLFAENLRFVLEGSEVNDSIYETISNSPEHFWYFNNGLTAICDTVQKSALGGGDTASGLFDVKAVSFVNGAQTIGSIGRASAASLNLSKVKVQVRFIALASTPEGFGSDVTRTNNTQNSVNSIDFVALDATQERLRQDLAKLSVNYNYRRGGSESSKPGEIDVREAAIALACSHQQFRYCVYAKRYVSGLWEDLKKEPYTALFPTDVSGVRVKNVVLINREFQRIIEDEAASLSGKERLVLVHGNRFLQHFAFRKLAALDLSKPVELADQTVVDAITALRSATKLIREKFEALFPGSYPGNVFKSQEKQSELWLAVSSLT
jgi:hypothetical protein